ncbi:NFACT RNA binding domain-containing protein [Bacteriovorax sp. Seq25_V]|uniref:NFACT RNA binding domain-containing protein n=1 Tax=Bacteriovorax sp. Seq25_V TaxID=1201288 RepID=UPI000389F7B1|nr:NFACT RNA binding domain-containing protein [Bacteriovorax sp. Seq25_V]EQC43430.1 PF05670 domain protein [Bacteriovorax sp. Seq25_V]
MNLNFSELHNSIVNIRSEFIVGDTWKFGKIQKIFSSGNVIVLNIRVPGKTLYLCIGRGNEYCGVWLLNEQIPSPYRIVRDSLLEYMRSNLVGLSVINIKADERDKSIMIELFDKSMILFFWKGRTLHFSHIIKENGKALCFSPWHSLDRYEINNDYFSVFDPAGRKQLEHKQVNESNLSLDKEKLFPDAKKDKQQIKKNNKKMANIEKDLKACALWQDLQELVINDQLDLETDILKYKGLKLKFERGLNYYQKKNKVFEKIKKLKIGEAFLKQRLENFREVISDKKSDLLIQQNITFPLWVKKSRKVVKKNSNDNGIEEFVIDGHKFAVGLSSHGNDFLRTNWSTKNDLWIHLDGYTSAHVIVKGDRLTDLNIISIAASIVATYSNFEADGIPVIFTQVSNLKGIKGKPGSVNYKKEKHLVVKKVNWKEIISSSWLK